MCVCVCVFVAFSPQANYTDWTTATGRRNLFQVANQTKQANSVILVSNRNIPTELPPFVGEGCRVVIGTGPYGDLCRFLDQIHYMFIQVAPQLYPQSWMDPVSVPVFLSKSGRAGNRNLDLWICSQASDR
jgi:hypothetical protein